MCTRASSGRQGRAGSFGACSAGCMVADHLVMRECQLGRRGAKTWNRTLAHRLSTRQVNALYLHEIPHSRCPDPDSEV